MWLYHDSICNKKNFLSKIDQLRILLFSRKARLVLTLTNILPIKAMSYKEPSNIKQEKDIVNVIMENKLNSKCIDSCSILKCSHKNHWETNKKVKFRKRNGTSLWELQELAVMSQLFEFVYMDWFHAIDLCKTSLHKSEHPSPSTSSCTSNLN